MCSVSNIDVKGTTSLLSSNLEIPMPHPDELPPDAELRRNAILRPLPDEELEQIRPFLELRELPVRHHVHGAGEVIEDVWFPLGAVFSSVVTFGDDRVVEVATIGWEGMVGLPVFFGAMTSLQASFCQITGPAVRLPADVLRKVLAENGAVLRRQLYRFSQATMVLMAQNVACNRTHPAEQRACRWLLMTQDRVGTPSFELTQDFLAQMLGVGRPTASLAAGRIQAAGLISYQRGVVTIEDRPGLEKASCECYGIVKDEYDRLLFSDD
jgi:CRP-like cAMP-binding protein